MAAPSRMSSVFSSRLHLNSPKDVANMPTDERGKLVLLVKTWRAKYERAQATTRQHNEYIRVLEADLARIKNEKEKVTTDLTERLEQHRKNYQKKIKALRLEAETARTKPEIEARYLRQKLEQVTNETQPILEFYKTRDEEKENKMKEMQETIDQLEKNMEELNENLQKAEDEGHEKVTSAEQKLEEINAKYLDQIEKVKKDCANQIQEVQKRMEEKAQTEANLSKSTMEQNYKDLQEEVQQKIAEARIDVEKEYKQQMATLIEDYNKRLDDITALRENEKTEFEKRQRLSETNVNHFKKEKDLIDKTLIEATKKLQKSRQFYRHLVFWELDGNMQKGKEPIISSASLTDLLQELATCQKDLRRMNLTLERYDKPEHILEHIERPQLLTEIDFYLKVNHIEYLKKLIRMKRLSLSRAKPRYQSKAEKPFVVLVPNTVAPEVPPVAHPVKQQQLPSIAHRFNRPTKPKPSLVKHKPEIVADRRDRRDQWLYRKPSTVQLFPVVSGRDLQRN